MSAEKKEDIDMHEIPKVEVYNDDEVQKRKNSLSTWVLVVILLLGGYYLWSIDNTSGNVVAEVTDAQLNKQVDEILNQISKETNNTTETPVKTDSGMVVKEFVEGDLVSFPYLDAKDPEGKNVSYTFSSPLNEKGEWQTKKGDVGEYLVTVKASDGVDSAEQKVLIVVKEDVNVYVEDVPLQPKNEAPVITYQDTVEVNEGDLVVLNPKVTDPDNNEVTVSYSGWMDSNTKQTDYHSAGNYEVLITAKDGLSESTKKVTVIVNEVNRAPVFNPDAFK
ncbi:hypothetical protein HY837_01740 [archaeon]|nr:hypothetical protein [archaeon]